MTTSPIEYCLLGRTALRVSRFCLGSLQGSGYSAERDRAFVRTLRAGSEAGLNFVDTAEGYGNGHAEKLVAQALAGRRGQVILASKFSHNHSAPAEIRRSLEGTLRRFKTDYLDIYQQHWPPVSPPLSETLEAQQRLKSEGKIRAIGVCNWMEPEFAEIASPESIDVLQNCYNLLWRSIEPVVLPICLRAGIAVLCYSPLCQGILAGRGADDDASGIRRANRFANPATSPSLRPLQDEMTRLACMHQKTRAQIALRWLLQKPVAAVIVGNSTPAQLEENLGAFGWSLSEADMRSLDDCSHRFSAGAKAHDTLWGWHSRER